MSSFLRTLCLSCALAACTQSGSRSSSAAAVTVNGVAFTEDEVQLALKPSGHGSEASPQERRKAVIAALVHEELRRQKAQELGLEPEGAAADELARLEAVLDAARRRALAEAFARNLAKKAEPSEQEVRRFFDANAALLRNEFLLSQIFLRDEAQITRAEQELKAGAPFEEVARRQYPNLPEGVGLPWELGPLSWKQLPDQWRPVLQRLEAGQSSSLIRGPGNRFWIIKLLERRVKSDLSFEALRPVIVEDLKRARLEQLAQQADLELRKAARIVEP